MQLCFVQTKIARHACLDAENFKRHNKDNNHNDIYTYFCRAGLVLSEDTLVLFINTDNKKFIEQKQ